MSFSEAEYLLSACPRSVQPNLVKTELLRYLPEPSLFSGTFVLIAIKTQTMQHKASRNLKVHLVYYPIHTLNINHLHICSLVSWILKGDLFQVPAYFDMSVFTKDMSFFQLFFFPFILAHNNTDFVFSCISI